MISEPNDAITKFADAVGRRDFGRMSEQFVEDAVWESQAGDLGFRNQGRKEIEAWLARGADQVEVLFYMTSQPLLEYVSADRVRSRLSVSELLRINATGEIRELFGVYNDELVLRDGHWRFAHRTFTLKHQRVEKETAALR